MMDTKKLKRWCYFNVILPGTAMIDGNNTTDIGPTCHIPAVGPTEPEWWLFTPIGLVVLITIITATVLGIVLAVHYVRRERVLWVFFRKGTIQQEQFKRLR